MANTVPYSGAPDVAPSLDPIPTPHVNAPGEAFGSAVAGAITHLGETAQGAGKEIFQRAYAMQTMDEDMKADKASSDVADRMTERYLEFDKLKGNDRAAGFPKYQQDLDKIREDGAGTLDSPYAIQQYLRDSRRTQNSMIWHGGTLARQGMDEANKITQDSVVQSTGNTLAATGTSSGPIYDKAIADAKAKLAHSVMIDTGFAPGTPENDTEVAKHLSRVNGKIAGALAAGPDPDKAKDFIEHSVRTGTMDPETALPLSIHADNAIATKGARGVAHSVSNGDPAHWGDEPYDTPLAIRGLKAGSGTSGSINSIGPDLPDGSHAVGTYGANSKLIADKLPGLNLTDEAGNKVTDETGFRNSAKAQREFVEAVFPDLQKDGKTFKEALKTWSGTDDPTRTNAALHEIAKNSDPSVVRDKAAKAAAEKFPNSQEAQDNASELAEIGQTRHKHIDLMADMDKRQTVVQAITTSVDGRVPTSLDEALKDKNFSDKYYQLEAPDQRAVLNVLQKNAALGGVRENGTGLRLYQELKANLINADTTTDPKDLDRALSTNVLQMPLSPQHINELTQLQHKVMSGAGGNVYVNRAIQLPAVQKLLTDAGIDKKSNPTEFNNFSIALHDAISNFDQGANRRPSDDELLDTAKGLVSVTPGKWFGTNTNLKYSNIYDSIDNKDGKGDKVRDEARKAYLSQYGKPYDPVNSEEVDRMNRLMNQMIFTNLGANAGAKMKKPGTGQ